MDHLSRLARISDGWMCRLCRPLSLLWISRRARRGRRVRGTAAGRGSARVGMAPRVLARRMAPTRLVWRRLKDSNEAIRHVLATHMRLMAIALFAVFLLVTGAE